MTIHNVALLAALCASTAIVSLAPIGCADNQSSPFAQSMRQRRVDRAKAQQLAREAEHIKKPSRAIAKYREAVALYPDFGAAWNNLGLLLLEQEDYLLAAEAFARASDAIPADPRPMYNLGLTWERRNYGKESLNLYLKSLERDERYLPALRGAIRIERTLGIGTSETLERLRWAISQEKDPSWQRYFKLERLAVEQEVYSSSTPSMYSTEEASIAPDQ